MEYYFMRHNLIPEIGPGLVVDLLWAGYLIVRYAAKLAGVVKLWQRSKAKSQGELLLQIEAGGVLYAHIAFLSAEQRGGKSTYTWKMTQIHRDDFPYFARTDLPFTHIWVTQKPTDEDLLTISVAERTGTFWYSEFYWIKRATIGTRPGFPRELLLPHNFVLKYVEECSLGEKSSAPLLS